MRSVLGDSLERLLIVGPHKSGKTSISFHLAIERACKCEYTLIVCNKSKIEASLPLPIDCSTVHQGSSSFDSDPSLLSFVGMKYVGSVQELKAVFAGLHAYTPVPSLVIVEDLSTLIDPLFSCPRTDSMFLVTCLSTLAIINDAVDYVGGKGGKGSSLVDLVITDNCLTEAYLQVVMRSCSPSGRTFNQLRLLPRQEGDHQSGTATGCHSAINSAFREVPHNPHENEQVSRVGGGVSVDLRRANAGDRAPQAIATVKLVVEASDPDPGLPIVGSGKKPVESLSMIFAS